MAEVIDAPPSNADEDVFLYMGEGGPRVPDDVIRVRVHSSVTAIPGRTFKGCHKLEEVELCEGVEEIGEMAFHGCRSLKIINIPTTLRVIGGYSFFGAGLSSIGLPEGMEVVGRNALSCCYDLQRVQLPSTLKIIESDAFAHTSLRSIDLPDGLESIERCAFYDCKKFACIRIPPLITTIPGRCFQFCRNLVSIELPENLRAIKQMIQYVDSGAFKNCNYLRNIAIPPDTEVDCDELMLFEGCYDLEQLFGLPSQILQALKTRFDGLPIHRMVYYQSYNATTPDLLNDACNLRSGQSRTLRRKLNPTGNNQDTLGMTPLHILACSTKQDIALYQVIIDNYPENLITQDRWGTLPIFYAIWRNAPKEVIQFLVESYQSIYSDYELNWNNMVNTLAFGLAPPEAVIQKVLNVQQSDFPQQVIDWEELLDKLIEGYDKDWRLKRDYDARIFKFLIQCSISKRVNSIGVRQWRDGIMSMASSSFTCSKREFLSGIRTQLANYERQFVELKEGTTVLELALWKAKIDETKTTNCGKKRNRGRKKIKVDEQHIRDQCRISSGADTVIENVLPYILPTGTDK